MIANRDLTKLFDGETNFDPNNLALPAKAQIHRSPVSFWSYRQSSTFSFLSYGSEFLVRGNVTHRAEPKVILDGDNNNNNLPINVFYSLLARGTERQAGIEIISLVTDTKNKNKDEENL